MLTNFNFEQSVSKAPRKTSPVGFTLKAANLGSLHKNHLSFEMTGTQQSSELGQDWGYYGTGTTKPECHLPAVVHLLSLLHKWEGGLAVAQAESETEQSKGLLFSLVKKFSASAISLLAGSANPPGLLLAQNLAL